MKAIKYDLGIRGLLPEWKKIFESQYFKEDLIAGLIVACIAIPLSLAIALASNVPPAMGLITAIIAGIVCAFFGGTTLAVSGPAAAISVLIASNVDKFGLKSLVIIGLICGVLQIFSGMIGLGRIMKFVPVSVIGGFTAGIGAIILIGQLPRALGLHIPNQENLIDTIVQISYSLKQVDFGSIVLAIIAFSIIQFLPKVTNKLPSPLFAVIVPTILMFVFPFDKVDLIGKIPRSLPLPSVPSLSSENFLALFFAGVTVYFLASLETLLSSSAVDKIVKVQKHDPNQELIGQGLGNMASALFGGIPVTGVIARTALNIKVGAKTRRASIIHSLVLVMSVFIFAPLIQYVPIPALAGILISVALHMLDIKGFFALFRIDKFDAYVFLVTFIMMIYTNLLIGIQTGLIAAILLAFIRRKKSKHL